MKKIIFHIRNIVIQQFGLFKKVNLICIFCLLIVNSAILNSCKEKDAQPVPATEGEKVDAKSIESIKANALTLLKDFPDTTAINTSKFLSNDGKAILNRIRHLLEGKSKFSSNTSKKDKEAIDQEFFWAARTIAVALRMNDGGTGGTTTCRGKCQETYDKCYGENLCQLKLGTCPCDKELSACVAKCLLKGEFSGAGGTVLF